MLGNLSIGELMVILLVILLLFGAKRLPELARSLGKSISEFKKGMSSTMSEIQDTLDKVKPELKDASSERLESGHPVNQNAKSG